jgi:polyhydroxybutyrate depolymerase
MERRAVLGVVALGLVATAGTALLLLRPVPAATATAGQGCALPGAGSGKFEKSSIRVGKLERTYSLFVPRSYASSRPYPVIFRFHGSGGDGQSGGLGIERFSGEDAIVVGVDGQRERDGSRGWDETRERADLALFDALLAELSARYCVDHERIFAYGFSAGAAFSERLACVRGDVLRGIAAIAAYNLTAPKLSTCKGQAAALLFHDNDDPAVPIGAGRASRDVIRSLDHCSEQADPEPHHEGCVRYRDCSEGQPVVWCESHALGHDIRGDVAPERVWSFFESL